MANNPTYRGNLLFPNTPGPLVRDLPFEAGSVETIERGDILELGANSGGLWAKMDADQAMTGIVAISAYEITATHRAGNYPVLIPRYGDIWEYALSAAGNPDRGAALYWSAAQVLKESGNNVLARVVTHGGFDPRQGNADVGDAVDRGDGTTIVNQNLVIVSFVQAASYAAALFG